MPRGKVESFDADQGHGQVCQDLTGEVLFVHESALLERADVALKPGQVVYFERLDGPHGKQAVEVRRGGSGK